MSTTTLWDDNFSSYPLGPGHPTNSFDPGGDTVFVDFGTMTGHTSAPGFYEQTGHGLQLNGDQIYYLDTSSNDVQSAQIVWLSFNGVFNISAYNVNLATFTGAFPGQGQTIISCVLNSDYTIGLYVSSTLGSPVGSYPIACSTQQVFFSNTWQMWQLNIETGQIVVLGTSYLTVAGTLALEGTQVCIGTTTTNINVSTLYLGEPYINQYGLGGAPGGYSLGYFGNFTGITGTPLPPFGTWPHPLMPDAYYTQSVAEWIGTPDTSVRQARMTQGVSEVIKLPSSSSRYARMTQGVVEVILRFPPSLGYWLVYEA